MATACTTPVHHSGGWIVRWTFWPLGRNLTAGKQAMFAYTKLRANVNISSIIHGTSDIMGQIAFLMLMGIVMKNGILLVDYTNQLRSRGMSLFEAALRAGPKRMRPVLMTAVSTIFGMLPLALGTGDGSEWRARMGIVVIGGLVTSTLLTLVVVPVIYTLLDEAHTYVM